MKRYFIVLCMLACAGCAPAVTKVNVTDLAKSDALQVHDMRPASEKEDKIFSLLITSKEYGVIRMGDAKLSPSPVRLLQHEAFQKLASDSAAHNVTVYHLVVYENARSQLRAGAIGAGVGGVLGALVGNAVATHDTSSQTRLIDEMSFNSVSSEYLRGQYSASENPNSASVFVVYVDTDIDGKKVFTRTVASAKPHGDENPLAGAVELAIRNHLSRYGAGDVKTAAQATPMATALAAAVTTSTVAATPAASQPATGGVMSIAQRVASQMDCGAVRPADGNAFLASCGAYDVLIDCDGDKCRPTRTINAEANR